MGKGRAGGGVLGQPSTSTSTRRGFDAARSAGEARKSLGDLLRFAMPQ